MKKSIFIAAAILTGSMVFAQQKKEKQPPPPPPPPVVDVKQIPPPPPPPKEPPPPKVIVEKFPSANDAGYQAFLKRNPSVKGIGWSHNHTVRIHLKSGKEEVFNLNHEADALRLKDKYGELPEAPPPPPPPRVKKISRA